MDEKDLKIIELKEELKKYKRIGHWIELREEETYQCSECRMTERSGCYYLYCPNCGARMEVEHE